MGRVLIVDDELDTLNFLQVLLQKQGYETLPARDGCEALALLETQPVDLILADVGLPHLNGYQLYERVKASPDPRLALIPFIFLSGRTLDSDIRYGKALGADDYLVKPVVAEDLLAGYGAASPRPGGVGSAPGDGYRAGHQPGRPALYL